MLRIPYLAGLFFILVLSSCDSQEIQYLTVDFQFSWRGNLKHCIDPNDGIKGLAFFVSEFALNKPGKSPADLTFVDTSHDTVGLIRFETCSNHVKSPTLKLQMPPDNYTELSFYLGIPFDLNHQNPVVQPSPLNVASMFWTWRLGYKFLRLDMDQWSFHLGSGGCVSPSAVRAPKTPCKKPNLARVALINADEYPMTIILDLDNMLSKRSTESAANCMDGFYETSNCLGLIKSLGLSGEDGTCIDNCKDQKVFRIRP